MLKMLTTNCENLEVLQLKLSIHTIFNRNYNLDQFAKIFFGYTEQDVESKLFNWNISMWQRNEDYCSGVYKRHGW